MGFETAVPEPRVGMRVYTLAVLITLDCLMTRGTQAVQGYQHPAGRYELSLKPRGHAFPYRYLVLGIGVTLGTQRLATRNARVSLDAGPRLDFFARPGSASRIIRSLVTLYHPRKKNSKTRRK